MYTVYTIVHTSLKKIRNFKEAANLKISLKKVTYRLHICMMQE